MDYSSASHETRTNADQGVTAADLRVSFESVLPPESEERLRRKKCFRILQEAISYDERLMAGSVVYFIEGAGLIKIGTSHDVRKRMCAIRNSSPVPVRLLAVMEGKRIDEGVLHRRFDHLRRHGEWFEDTPELREGILSAINWGRAVEDRIKTLGEGRLEHRARTQSRE